MYNHETKNQFIELRAQGLSLDAISAQLDVPRATLGRWHHESIEQIQRLRALQWHLLEEQIGHRLEDPLQRVAQRIGKWQDELDRRNPSHRKTVEVLRIIRDSRREYLQLRSLLLAPLQPTRTRANCLTSLDPQKRDKTRQNQNTQTQTPLPTNDLQQPEPTMSHSAPAPISVTPEVTRGLTSPETVDNPPPQPANVANNCPTNPSHPVAEAHNLSTVNNRGNALPLPRGEGWGEGQTGTSPSPVLPVSERETHDNQSNEAPAAALAVPAQSDEVTPPSTPAPPQKNTNPTG